MTEMIWINWSYADAIAMAMEAKRDDPMIDIEAEANAIWGWMAADNAEHNDK